MARDIEERIAVSFSFHFEGRGLGGGEPRIRFFGPLGEIGS